MSTDVFSEKKSPVVLLEFLLRKSQKNERMGNFATLSNITRVCEYDVNGAISPPPLPRTLPHTRCGQHWAHGPGWRGPLGRGLGGGPPLCWRTATAAIRAFRANQWVGWGATRPPESGGCFIRGSNNCISVTVLGTSLTESTETKEGYGMERLGW